jgi:hypothetical protein
MPKSMFVSISWIGTCTVQVNVPEVDAGAFFGLLHSQVQSKKHKSAKPKKRVWKKAKHWAWKKKVWIRAFPPSLENQRGLKGAVEATNTITSVPTGRKNISNKISS